MTRNAASHRGFFSVASYHRWGAHVLMGDGSIHFITDSIEAGNQNAPTVCRNGSLNAAGVKSPYGLWGALGTRANREIIEDFP